MLYFKPLFFYHMQDSASQQLKPKRLFLLYWSAEPLPDVLLQLDLSYQVPKIDHTQLDCLATLLSSSKCSFKKSFYKLTKSSCHMPWCVFASIEWKELLNKNNCWSPPPLPCLLPNTPHPLWEARAEAASMLPVLQHNALPSKMERASTKWLMAFLHRTTFFGGVVYLCVREEKRVREYR